VAVDLNALAIVTMRRLASAFGVCVIYLTFGVHRAVVPSDMRRGNPTDVLDWMIAMRILKRSSERGQGDAQAAPDFGSQH
jgi:hypothetical protein